MTVVRRSYDDGDDGRCHALAPPRCSRVIPHAEEGPELRGLRRLPVMAEQCAVQPGSSLVWLGD